MLESKEQIRKTGRQSPDKADALVLAFTAPEPKKGSDFHAWVMTDDGVVDIANPTPEQRERMEARRRARLSEIPPLQRDAQTPHGQPRTIFLGHLLNPHQAPPSFRRRPAAGLPVPRYGAEPLPLS